MTLRRVDDTRKEEWLTFLGNAIEGLRLAAVKVREEKERFEAYSDWFRPTSNDIPRENSVSQALKQMFDEIRAEQQISSSGVQVVDLRHIKIECERPRPFDVGISDTANPTDLSLVLMKDNELDLRIEAKTVLNETEMKAEYLGKRGLRRFDDNSNPYTVQPYGGMVAYVVNSDAATWTTMLGAAVEQAVGAKRYGKLNIRNEDYHVSRHRVRYKGRGNVVRQDVEVLHVAIEIDAKPPRR